MRIQKICRSSYIMLVVIAIFFLFSAQRKINQTKKNPANAVVFFEEKFEDNNLTSRGWYDNTAITLSGNEHIQGSTHSAQFQFLQGAQNPISGGAFRRKFSDSDSVYLSYWVKYSDNYTGSDKPYHPHEFLIMTNKNNGYDGPAFTYLTAYVEQNEGIPLLSIQDGQNIDQKQIKKDIQTTTENRSVAGCNGIWSDGYSAVDCYVTGSGDYWNGKQWKANNVHFQNGKWYHVEAFFKLNTIEKDRGIASGKIKYWLDGKVIIESDNVLMRTGKFPDMKFNQFLIAPHIGPGSPVDQSFWIDDLVIANTRQKLGAP